jgi:hypothetical protein
MFKAGLYTGASRCTAPFRRVLQGRWWWLLPLALMLIPAALVLFWMWNTPDWANFEYHPY